MARGLFPGTVPVLREHTAIDCARLLYFNPRFALFYDPPSRRTTYKDLKTSPRLGLLPLTVNINAAV